MLGVSRMRIDRCGETDFLSRPAEFGWILLSGRRQTVQTGFRIVLAEEERAAAVWETEEETGRTQAAYTGPDLKPLCRYIWKLEAYDNHGERACGEQYFTTGRLDIPWKSAWIEPVQLSAAKENVPAVPDHCVADPDLHDLSGFRPAQYLRKSFNIAAPFQKAYLFATAHGIYLPYINGARAGKGELLPGTAPYHEELPFQSFDITGLLNMGENTVGMVLADGWWAGRIGLMGRSCEYGDRLACLFEIIVFNEDGSRQTVTDENCRSSEGPIRSADLFVGECYDARMEADAWNTRAFQDCGWKPVPVIGRAADNLHSQKGSSVQILEKRKPVRIWKTPNGETVLDAGETVAGWIELSVTAAAGTKIILDHSETLDRNGNFMYSVRGRNKDQRDIYITREGAQTWQPHFTYHGFRYVRIRGWPGMPSADSFTVCVIGTPVEKTGTFLCDDWRLNRLHENIWRSQRGNLVSVPTDCPQREKAGWTADILLYAPTLLTLSDGAWFLKRWLDYCRLEQRENGLIPFVIPFYPQYRDFGRRMGGEASAGWSDVIVLLPWSIYEMTGDEGVLQENYPAMKRWMHYIETKMSETAAYAGGDPVLENAWMKGFHFGDWLVPGIMAKKNAVPMDSAKATKDYAVPAYTAWTARTLSEIAHVLGRKEDEAHYRLLYEKIRTAYRCKFFDEGGQVKSDFQGACVLSLAFGLAPKEARQETAGRLCRLIAKNHGCLDTGFLSVPYLLDALADNGKEAEAYKLLFQDRCPGWLYMVEQGATTVWESWDCVQPDGSKGSYSYNHFALGCVGAWLYRSLAGIRPLEPGFGKIAVMPGIDSGLKHVRAEQMLPQGKLCVEWELKPGEPFVMRLEIPVGTVARICLPARLFGTEAPDIEGMDSRVENGMAVFHTGSGKYLIKGQKS